MRHDLTLEGFAFRLRPVRRDDAKMIVDLRCDPRNGHYLNATSPRVEDQEAWLDAYFARPGDWYFALERITTGQVEGLIGLYDHDPASATAEWGRWIVCEGSLGSVESALLIYRAAFQALDLEAVYCRTVAANAKVVSFHDSTGVPRAQILNGSATIRGEAYDQIEHRLTKAAWPTVDQKLAALAQRIATRINGRVTR